MAILETAMVSHIAWSNVYHALCYVWDLKEEDWDKKI